VGELDPEGGSCDIWGSDETASPPEAAMMNTALIRYLDYMDALLLPGETLIQVTILGPPSPARSTPIGREKS